LAGAIVFHYKKILVPYLSHLNLRYYADMQFILRFYIGKGRGAVAKYY
jgi:hypothetical protein